MLKALVTGASSGIGLAIAQILSQNNYKVFGVARHFKEEHSKYFTPIVLDLQKMGDIEKTIKIFKKEHTVNLLVNCAGIGYFAPHEELNISKISQMIDVNLKAPLVLSQLLLRDLKKTEGSIINITSIEALQESKFSAVYSASKAGLRHFGNTLFQEVRKSGVKVTTINPDLTQSAFFDHLHFTTSDNENSFLYPKTIANEVLNILSLSKSSTISELTIRPQKFKINKKKNSI